MQTQGSLQESSLASLLQTMQTERATGALSIESASDTASLFFLFGHLFHASGPTGQGEDVVITALGWHDGNYHFDPRAKLPPEETIKASPSELVAEAERRGPAGRTEQPVGADASAGWAAAASPGSLAEAAPAPAQFETAYAGQPAEEYPAASWASSQPDHGSTFPVETAAPERGAGGDAGYTPWAAAPGIPQYEAPALEPAPEAETPEPSQPAAYEAPAAELYHPPAASSYQPAAEEAEAEPTPAPSTAATSVGAGAVLGAPSAAPLEIVYPLPSGKSQYEGLKSAFVDFPKLLRTLRGDEHTGYVRLTGGDFSGVLLFHQGHLLQALSSDGAAQIGDGAFLAVRRQMDAGTGTIDVIDLSGDIVDALAQLLTAPLLYTGLLGRFVNFTALLEHLGDEKIEGAVVVVGGDDVGIILLNQGVVLGAYTAANASLDTSPAAVAKIAAEKAARIEVKSSTGSVAGIDVESVLNQPY